MAKIAPSVLAANFGQLDEELERVAAADRIHLDVMDGRFVPRVSFGPPVIEAIRDRTDLPLDAHLMVADPAEQVDQLTELGVEAVTVHAESVTHLYRLLDRIRDYGLTAGVALNPATGFTAVEHVASTIDRVLVMGVSPGFAGQSFIPATLEKIERIDGTFDGEIGVDGGVTHENAADCIDAGADLLVSGSAVFGSEDCGDAIRSLRGRVKRGIQ